MTHSLEAGSWSAAAGVSIVRQWPGTTSNGVRSTRSASWRWTRVQKANAGHPGTAMALAPVAYLIYTEFLRHNPANPAWPDRDRFVLSAGHACILQYATLHLTGYDLLARRPASSFASGARGRPGHPEHVLTPGVETTTGPLGQGFANGVGFGARRALPGPAVQPAAPRDRRPPRLRDLLRRRPDGGRRPRRRRSIAGHLGARQADLPLRRQQDHDRRHDGRLVLDARTRASASRRTAGTCSTSHDVNDLDELRAAFTAARDEIERPSLIVVPHAHRLPGAARDRHVEGARLAARRGRGARDEGGARLGSGRDTSSFRTASTST